jgi:hypothetical protein
MNNALLYYYHYLKYSKQRQKNIIVAIFFIIYMYVCVSLMLIMSYNSKIKLLFTYM